MYNAYVYIFFDILTFIIIKQSKYFMKRQMVLV